MNSLIFQEAVIKNELSEEDKKYLFNIMKNKDAIEKLLLQEKVTEEKEIKDAEVTLIEYYSIVENYTKKYAEIYFKNYLLEFCQVEVLKDVKKHNANEGSFRF